MIAPTLLVGLGGTGSKIVCRVSQMVTEEQRKRIGFAVFDTDINELREIREANPFIKTIQTSTKLTVGEYLNIDTHARDEWFPVNGILNSKSLTEGAGQVRAISRLALDTAIRAGNMEPLHNAIEELYKLEGDSSEQALRVVIVSSLAGGTGSGLILPVALYLKNYLATKFQASANITRGFFILPEVFYEVIRGQSERKIDKKTQQEFKDKLRFYIGETDKYRTSSVLAEVLAEGIDYISSLCEAFQNFYTSFENRIEALDRRIAALSKKYGNTAGRTSRYVCATPNCFQRLLKEMPYTGSSITIDKELAEEIYNKVRNYSMLKDKPENGGYFEQIFDNGIIGYFKKSLMEIYGSTVNMDVLTALEKEAKYEKNEYDATRIEQYVKKVIAETRNLSNPFIERPLGEQKAPIAACTYSKELDPKDDSPRSMLIAKELGNYGGTPDEDIPLNMIMFYQSIYGLRANKLSKFSPGCAAEGRSDGEYYKAYYEVVSQIKPKSDKTPVITPHIDRNWHIVSALPDLDEENQRRQEREIYRAFALGIICDLVCYSKISEGKYLYRLELNDLEPEEFVVSNGTPCDHYYEVLDALTINPVAVQTILSYMKEKFADERNSSGKLDFEHSYLRRQINELASIEYGKAGLSIFDVALLLKVSTPSAEFDKTVGKGIMREILTLIYEYAQTMVLEADLDGIYGKFVLEQFEMFDKNIDWYMDNWKDNFSDYINDLMRIAVSDIERKKLTDIYEKMRKIMKESSKKRG